MKAATPAAIKLFNDGAAALAQVEANGMKIDLPYLDRQIEVVGNRISKLEAKLKACDEYKEQRKRYGQRCNLTSLDQLAHVLYEVQGYSPLAKTPTGKPQLDEAAMEAIGTQYCRGHLRMSKLRKLRATHMMGVRRAAPDGFLHPSFLLHIVITYRGCSQDPNFQNINNREQWLAEIIRTAFIPRRDHVLLEIDLKANEVRLACTYTGDERLAHDTINGDMHGDMAAEIFCLPRNEVPKNVRFEAKGKFVFAEFYGDYWKVVAKNLWDGVGELKTADGTEMFSHLAVEDIGELDSFSEHIKEIEHKFWNERYQVYNQWKLDWFDQYCRRGWYDMLSGFVCRGVYSRNQVNNGPIQGTAFHCLLWVLIELNKWLQENKMRTLIIGQIHDSIELDAHKDELEDVKAKAKELLETSIMKAWPWLTVPLAGEAEVAEENWYDKYEVEL